jgi:hypothetical protein
MKIKSYKVGLDSSVSALFLFALLLGIEIGFIHENMSTARSIIINESVFSLGNLFLIYVAAVFLFLSFKVKITQLKIAYMIGGISLMLIPSIVCRLGINVLYIIIIKVVLLFITCSICVRYITRKLKDIEIRD